MRITAADQRRRSDLSWSLHLGAQRHPTSGSVFEACLRDLNAFLRFGGLGSAGLPGRDTWEWSLRGDSAVLTAALPVVGTRAWFLLLQVVRFIDSDVIEVPFLEVPAEHEGLASMTLDAFADWNHLAAQYAVALDHVPPDVTVRVFHSGDQAASNLLLDRLGVWFSVVSEGAFSDGLSASAGGWIALEDAPESRPGLVALNLTDVACHDLAFHALQSMVSHFHESVARVREFELS